MRLIKAFIYSNLIAIPLTILVYIGISDYLKQFEVVFEEFHFDTKPTVINDRNGESLVNFYPDRRTVSMYDEVPKEIIEAFVASEDRNFFEHAGISIKGITRAAFAILRADGAIVQGGSTVTQQFVKMSMLTSEKSYVRKLKEIMYALQLEEVKSKEEIMELYLNQLEYKYQAFGIKDALRTYFGISYQEFNELERPQKIKIAALMAAMVQNPTVYDPFRKVELTTDKRDVVVYNMYLTNKISESEYNAVKGSSLEVLESPQRIFEDETIKNKELVHYALTEAAKVLNMSVEEVKESGYDIATSFDLNIYNLMRKAFEDDSNFPKNSGSGGSQVEGSAIFISPLNGEILAFTGGRNEIENFMDFNRAFQMKKQPASSFKPIIAYGPALESGKFSPNSYLLDEAGHVFPGGYSPKNYSGTGRGKVTMKQAIRQSYNIPAVWTLQQVGVPYAKEYASKLGIDLSDEPNYLSLALGGLEKGVSPLEMADAYQAFATGGYRTEAHSIRLITDRNGKVIYKKEINTKNIINTKNAKEMKNMLKDVVQNGTGKSANYASTVGGKTGTNQHALRKGAVSDFWFVGFDDDVIVGSVWVGFDKLSKNDYLPGSSSYAGKLFKTMAQPISKIVKNYKLENEFNLIKKDDGEEYVVKNLPEIMINGKENIVLEYGEEYVELGATAKDDNFGDLTNQIHISGSVDSSIAGEYLIKYQLLEGYDVVIEKTRKVTVKEKKTTSTDYSKNLEYSLDNGKVMLYWDKYEEDGIEYKVYKNDRIISTLKNSTSFKDTILPNENAVYQVVVVKQGSTIIATKTVNVKYKNNEVTEEPEKVPVEPEEIPEEIEEDVGEDVETPPAEALQERQENSPPPSSINL